MKLFAKLAVGAAMIGSLAMATTAPADAGVTVHVGVGGHHYYGHHYYGGYHGYRGYHRSGVVLAVGPYFWHGRHYHHRRMSRGVWVYY
jgi:hypothetical protein